MAEQDDGRFMRETINRLVDDRVRAIEVGGSGGNNGGMDEVLRRITALEGDIRETRTDIGALVADGNLSRERLAALDSKISNMPSSFQVVTWQVGVAVAIIGFLLAALNSMNTKFDGLNVKLTDEFRAQRAEMSAQTSAIANSITATKQGAQQPIIIQVPASK